MARYLLGDRAAAWIKAQMKDANAVQIASASPTRKARVASCGGGGGVIQPFTVRWSETAVDSSTGGWEVYIPASAVDLAAWTVLLTAATETGWYLVQGVGASWTSFVVEAHVKAFVHTPNAAATATNVVTVTAYETTAGASDADRAGDVKATTLANVSITTSGTVTQRTVGQLWRGPLAVEPRTKGMAECEWTCTGAGAAFLPFIDACQIYGYQCAAVTLGAAVTAAYFVLDCSTYPPTGAIETAAGTATSDVSIKLYGLSSGRVTEDTRADASKWNLYP